MSHDNGQRFLQRLLAARQDLPFSPQVLKALFSQTGDSAAVGLPAIAATIGQDQGLSGRILAMANSAYYGLQSQVASIERAVAVLGLRELRILALALAAQSLAGRHPPPPDFDLPGSWLHQLAVAATARGLCGQLSAAGCDRDGDDLFAAGLLHDVGKLLAAMHSPDDWRAIAARQAQGQPYIEAEEAHWGLDHGVVGALLLKAWNLPDALTEPVSWHHFPENCPSRRQQALLLAAADGLVVGAGRPDGPDAQTMIRLAALRVDPGKALELARQSLADEGHQALVRSLTAPPPAKAAPAGPRRLRP